jgi:hypothetical protein
MKIIYNVNPLATRVEIDDDDRKKIYENIKDLWFDNEPEKALDYKSEHIKDLEDALLGDHHGDCIFTASSCVKCEAEGALEIETKVSDKEVNHAISGAFSLYNDIEKIYQYLASDPVKSKEWETCDPTGERWNASLQGWNVSRRRALEWLKKYHTEHGFT